MDKLYEELFRAMNQFRKLKFAEMFPMINRTDFFVMCTIMDKGENGKITISELASRAKMLPSAISRTLKGLEERGYVERNINKNDRRNTYVESSASVLDKSPVFLPPFLLALIASFYNWYDHAL